MGKNFCNLPIRQRANIQKILRSTNNLNKSRKKANNPIKKCAKDMNRHFSKEDIFAANKHMKTSSSSLVIREMLIKTTLRYHPTQLELQSLKNQETKNTGEDVEKQERFYTVDGSVN